MISLRDVLDLWGFTDHPFETYTAEKEARLSDYFVAPPYIDDVLGTADAAAPAIVFGARGIGKSAIRIFTENLAVSGKAAERLRGGVLAVTYDEFSHPLRDGLAKVSLNSHLEAVLQKLVCAALVRIAREVPQPLTEEGVRKAFPSLDFSTFARLVARYFTSLSELQRQAAFRGVYDYFKELTADRLAWFEKMWLRLRVPLVDVANMIQAVRGKQTLQLTPPSATPSAPSASNPLDDYYALAAMAPQFGVASWYVLVDKVDETDSTDSDAAKAFQLVAPLLKNLRVLETPRVAFKFFFWAQLRPFAVESGIRLDKMRNFEMSWTPAELREMIDRRLGAFSGGKVSSLSELTEATVGEHIYDTVITHANSSPREIVQVLDALFREHARHSTPDTGAMISAESVERGLDEYCVRRVKDLYSQDVIRQFGALPAAVFTSSDVQSTFRISKAAASGRINQWVDNGHVKRIEDTRSHKDPSKAVYQYELTEPRLRRILERRLSTPSGAS